MKLLIFFFIVIFIGYYVSDYYIRIVFKNISLKRELSKNRVFPGEEFKVNVFVENRKLLPISFLNIKEQMPRQMERKYSDNGKIGSEGAGYSDSYFIAGRERVRRSYPVHIKSRGVYILKNMEVSISDFLGVHKESRKVEDYFEIVVFPRLKSLVGDRIISNSILGDNTVKRWIYDDPMYVKGIREYTYGDRMKDIHWNSSLKNNKLLVKDYDFTSDREVVIILNTQYKRPLWMEIDPQGIDRGCEIAAAVAEEFLNLGIATGIWSNSHIISYYGDLLDKVPPSLKGINGILEFCGRIGYMPKTDFYDYLKSNMAFLNKNTVYIIIAGYLTEDSKELLYEAAMKGIIIKLIDISCDSSLSNISRIELLRMGEK